jgi:F-type H+-transporting ATPase subunit b
MTIDWWTLGLQTVNVAVLIWLLGRFFWRPIATMIAERRDTTRQALADVDAQRAQAEAALTEVERTRAGFAREREAILAAAQEAAERETAARREEAAKQAAAIEAAGRAAIESERQAAERAWAERAAHLAVEIAERLAARLDGEAVRAAFLDWLIAAIRALPEEKRRLAVTDGGGAIEAISATPFDASEQERARARIAEALGADPRIAFAADPKLIAGLELKGPHLVVSNSWRADLDHILADIAHDEGR